jgi:hypothetical protein
MKYSPKTAVGQNLLSSIPKKIEIWLTNLGEFSPEGSIKQLSWSFADDGTAMICFDEAETLVEIWRDGDMVSGSEYWFDDIENNLPKFTELERKIYCELELLAKEVDERNLQASKAARDQ